MITGALASGVVAVFSGPGDLWAQTTGTVTCWAESCSGNVCVRVQIECPKEPKVVTAT
ncbi:hypothetical protein [Longimicrobium sp.]|uniref:hypothetical protein n=1 Tax=Longimicrobium sp. TaxID=2029185 RepID=UPI002E350AD0|nr:hypothetical protein [Longimicrobium sp.]HEX6036451.1 hypothetical protein [Longimicrobium sp.]